MKRLTVAIALIFLLATILGGCGGGSVNNVNRIIGGSQIYKTDEIEAAMDTVVEYFRDEFAGCTLTELRYQEDSQKESDEWAEQYQAEEAIVLYSTFQVDSSGGDGSLEPNSTYANWKWVLTRSNGGNWTLQTWGYG